uniref:SAM_MT_RSMB_NOP domain-containing protein n=1 Tax=Parastrongyloides trichosuri TaxID=131310 RepID=A0A0N4ZHD0_PARTI
MGARLLARPGEHCMVGDTPRGDAAPTANASSPANAQTPPSGGADGDGPRPEGRRRRPGDHRRGVPGLLGADDRRDGQICDLRAARRQQRRRRHSLSDGPGPARHRPTQRLAVRPGRLRRGAILLRWRHHARHLGPVGRRRPAGGARPERTAGSLHPAAGGGHSDRPLPGAVARHGGPGKVLRPHHPDLVPVAGPAGRGPYLRRPVDPEGPVALLWDQAADRRRLPGLRHPGQRLPGRHRRRGAVCGHGPFRQGADPPELAVHRPAVSDALLPGPGRLPAPGDDHGRLLGHAAGGPAGPVAAYRHPQHFRDPGRPDLCARDQQPAAGRGAVRSGQLPVVAQPDRRLWRGGDGDHDGQHPDGLHRRASQVEVVVVGHPADAGAVRLHRRGLPDLQPAEDPGGRVDAAGAGRGPGHADVDLGARLPDPRRQDAQGQPAAERSDRDAARPTAAPGAGYGHLPDLGPGRGAGGPDAQSQAQQGAAREEHHPDCTYVRPAARAGPAKGGARRGRSARRHRRRGAVGRRHPAERGAGEAHGAGRGPVAIARARPAAPGPGLRPRRGHGGPASSGRNRPDPGAPSAKGSAAGGHDDPAHRPGPDPGAGHPGLRGGVDGGQAGRTRRQDPAVQESGQRRAARQPATDLTAKPGVDPVELAASVEGEVLPGGTVRTGKRGDVASWPGFEAGDWWVQDAAAAVPARLLAAKPGEAVLDMCAAPGGKTLQLAAAGAEVVAVDRSPARLKRL